MASAIVRCLVYAIVILLTACSSLQARMISERIADGFMAMDSYEGQVIERGVLGNTERALVSKVIYKKAWKIRSEVIEPAALKGNAFIYNGSTITLWWPKDLFGIRIRGASPFTAEQVRRHVKYNTRWSARNYAFSFLGRERIVQRGATRWKAFPTVKKAYVYPYESVMDAHYAIPLRLVVRHRPKAIWYSMSFRDVRFGVEVDEDVFDFEFPPNAVVFDWDIEDPGEPLAEVQKKMNFRMLLPKKLPRGHRVRKIIRARHCLPMATVVMNKDARWLSLTQMRDIGLSAKNSVGVRVRVGGETGYLTFLGAFSAVSWTREGNRLFLIGNLPYPELVAVAASVR